MIDIETFQKKPITIKVLEHGEIAPIVHPIQNKILEALKGKLYTYKELSELIQIGYHSVITCVHTLEKRGSVVRLVIDGVLYVGLTSDVREKLRKKMVGEE